MEVKLEVFKGPDKGKVFILNEPTTCVVGRGKDARFRLTEGDPYISRRHFLLEVAPPNAYFRDLDVTNPSKINDLYVEEAELSHGDIIEVGYTRLKVSLDLDVQIQKVNCSKCSKPFKTITGEMRDGLISDLDPTSFICSDCEKQQEKEEQIQISLPSVPQKIKCDCGKDLTKLANSDGRATELNGKVVYACKKCRPPKTKDGGQKINGYEVIKKLGEGGMGKVYLVYQPRTARVVALKVMNIHNRQLGARFNREIRIMKRIRHDNVLCYIDSGQDNKTGKPYLVMEFASSGNLEDLLMKNKTALTPSVAVQYIIHSLSGLEYIHNRQIVHRDIKAENILITRSNGKDASNDWGTPKIADFGLAREFKSAGGSILTQLGQALGTILYMPPEQIKDAHSAREPADLYSMGVTLYHLLTGQYPFNFPTQLDILKFLKENKDRVNSPEGALRLMMEVQKLKTPYQIVLEDKPIPIKKRNPKIPNKLAIVVDRAINKDISRRYQSAAGFRNQLEKLNI